jgi:hypothetical protein
MRFKKKPFNPPEYSSRTVRKFAFIPRKIGDYTIWLEFYLQNQYCVIDRYAKHFEWHSVSDELIS